MHSNPDRSAPGAGPARAARTALPVFRIVLAHPAARVALLGALVAAVLLQPDDAGAQAAGGRGAGTPQLARPAAKDVPAEAGVTEDSPAALSAGFDFSAMPEVRAFIAEMAAKHGFEPDALTTLFGQVRHQADALRLIAPAAPSFRRSWTAYRARMVDPIRTREGLKFWDTHRDALARAEKAFGVPAEVIVAIIGIETVYGRHTGTYRVMDTLATLAFDYPRRADYFRGELEQWLLHARDTGIDPLSVRGSFAGAVGLPQFMPTSLRRFAVDFDEDGRIDLRGNPADAIGSVARFLSIHGWQPGGRTHYPVTLAPDAGTMKLVEAGIEPRFTIAELADYGVRSPVTVPPDEKLALIDLPNGDAPTSWWLGARNFHAITRYNRSSFYAMAVIDLSETLRALRDRPKEAPAR